MKTKNGENSSSNEGIENCLNLNLKLLSYIGIDVSLIDNNQMKKTKVFYQLPIFMTNGLGIFAAILQIFIIIESLSQHEMFMATQVSSHLFSNMLCISKGYRMATTVPELQTILREIKTVWKNYPPHYKYREKILKGAHKTLVFCKVFISVTLSAIFSFGLPPLHNYLIQYFDRASTNHTYDYSQRVFILKYPFAINNSLTYFSILLEEEYLLFASGLYWVCCDTLFAQLTTHLSLQLQILQYDIEKLINYENTESRLKEHFIIFVERHRELLSVCDLVEYVFSPIVLTTVLLSGINICVNVFELSETISKENYAEASLHAFLFMNTFLQIVFYCTFAEMLTEQTGLISYSIYNCKWTEKSCKIKVFLQMLIMRSQNPFYCTGYGFFSIGHKRLTMVMNTAFSYYMMLQTTSQ